MKKTGLLLQELRIQRGYSLQEVSSTLKINVKTLQAIESGDITSLPKAAFVRGFVKSYTQYLKGDLEIILKEYSREMGDGPQLVEESPAIEMPQPEVEVEKIVKQPAPEVAAKTTSTPTPITEDKKEFSYSDFDSEQKQKGGWKIAIFLLLIIILSSVIFVSIRTIERYQRESTISSETEKNLQDISQKGLELPVASQPLPENQTLEPLEAPATAPQSSSANNMTSTTTTAKPVPKETVSATPAAPEANAAPSAASDGKAAPNAAPAPPALPETSSTQTAAPPEQAPVAAEAVPPKPAGKVREVIIEALESVKIDYETNGKKSSISLQKDQVHTFRSLAPITFRLNDGGAVNVNVNGTDRGAGGEKGNPVVLRY